MSADDMITEADDDMIHVCSRVAHNDLLDRMPSTPDGGPHRVSRGAQVWRGGWGKTITFFELSPGDIFRCVDLGSGVACDGDDPAFYVSVALSYASWRKDHGAPWAAYIQVAPATTITRDEAMFANVYTVVRNGKPLGPLSRARFTGELLYLEDERGEHLAFTDCELRCNDAAFERYLMPAPVLVDGRPQ